MDKDCVVLVGAEHHVVVLDGDGEAEGYCIRISLCHSLRQGPVSIRIPVDVCCIATKRPDDSKQPRVRDALPKLPVEDGNSLEQGPSGGIFWALKYVDGLELGNTDENVVACDAEGRAKYRVALDGCQVEDLPRGVPRASGKLAEDVCPTKREGGDDAVPPSDCEGVPEKLENRRRGECRGEVPRGGRGISAIRICAAGPVRTDNDVGPSRGDCATEEEVTALQDLCTAGREGAVCVGRVYVDSVHVCADYGVAARNDAPRRSKTSRSPPCLGRKGVRRGRTPPGVGNSSVDVSPVRLDVGCKQHVAVHCNLVTQAQRPPRIPPSQCGCCSRRK